MPSRTGYKDYQKARYISQIQGDQILREMRKKKAIAEREALKNTPEYKENVRKRGLLQAETRAKEVEIKQEIESLEATLPVERDDLIAQIKEDLQTLSAAEALTKNSKSLKKFENNSNRLRDLLIEKSPKLRYSFYAELFYELSLIEPQFILLAPAQAFASSLKPKGNHASFKLDQFSNEELNDLHAKISKENKSILYNDHFITYYSKFFKQEINQLKSLRDVKSCLVRYPEAFTDLNSTFKGLFKFENEMAYVISKAPSVIKYMTAEEIEELANNSLKLIATAVMRDPEVLDCLDEDFFDRHDYRICFTNYPKAKIKEVLGDKVKRHVLLQKFINSKIEFRTMDGTINY